MPQPSKQLNSMSVSDVFWGQITENRISFSFEGLPDTIHITIAWNKDNGEINLHLSKNIKSEENNKPKIVIATIEKTEYEKMINIIPSIIWNRLFSRVSFRLYGRKSRKNIKVLFLDALDDLEDQNKFKIGFEQMITQHAKQKRRTLKISPEIEGPLTKFTTAPSTIKILLKNLQNLTSRTFTSKQLRAGYLLMGNNQKFFFSFNGNCYATRTNLKITDILHSFMAPSLIADLQTKIEESIKILLVSNTWEETKAYHNPIRLLLEPIE